MRKKAMLKRTVAFAAAFSMTLSMGGFTALAATDADAQTLVITDVTCANGNTSTGQASTVQSVTYTLDGQEKTASVAKLSVEDSLTLAVGESAQLNPTLDEDDHTLTLVIDNEEYEIKEGATYEVTSDYAFVDTTVAKSGGPSAAPWSGASDDEKSVYYFRQALYLYDGEIQEDSSVLELIQGGTYDENSAEGITVTSNGAHFNGIYVSGTSDYSISESELYATGDGGDDFSGWGAALMTDENAVVTVDDSYIETAGTIRTAVWAGGSSKITVNNSLIYAQETEDDYATYTALVPAMMKRVPFALGMEGTIRATNVLGAGQAIYNNSMIVSTGWGALSTDSGSAYSQTGTYALTVNNSIGGIGTVEEFQAGKNYTATFELNGTTYGFTVGGSGYVTYADSGVWNKYTGVQFYSPDYVQIMASGEASSEYYDSYMYSERIAFMTQQAGGGTLTLTDSEVDTKDALMQIKSGAANKGYTNLVVDNTDVDFSGDSVRTEDGILVELVESDDAGNPGVTTYTINDVGDQAEATADEITDSTATFKNGNYTGDIWNSIYNYKQALVVTLENANLTGTVSSSVAVHVDPETGDVVENGTVLEAYTGSESENIANYLAEEGGTTGDYLTIGSFKHQASEMVNNPIDLTIDADSTWTITGTSYLNSLTVDSLDDITADEAVAVYTAELTVGGQAYDLGTYTEGNVTYNVVENKNVAEDTGVAASGQTYANFPYTFYVVNEDSSYNSKAVTVTTQNWTDGNVYYTLAAAEGYEIADVSVEGATISETPSTAASEVQQYTYVMVPASDAQSAVVTIKVSGGTDNDQTTDDTTDPAEQPSDPGTGDGEMGETSAEDMVSVAADGSTITLTFGGMEMDSINYVVTNANGEQIVSDAAAGGSTVTIPDCAAGDYTVAVDCAGPGPFEGLSTTKTVTIGASDAATLAAGDIEEAYQAYLINAVNNAYANGQLGETTDESLAQFIETIEAGDYTSFPVDMLFSTEPDYFEDVDFMDYDTFVANGGSTDTSADDQTTGEDQNTGDDQNTNVDPNMGVDPNAGDNQNTDDNQNTGDNQNAGNDQNTGDSQNAGDNQNAGDDQNTGDGQGTGDQNMGGDPMGGDPMGGDGDADQSDAAGETSFVFTASDDGIASIDAAGLVTGVAAGETVVTVDAYVDGELVASADVDVTVTDGSASVEPTGTTPTDNNNGNTTNNNTSTTTSAKTGDANRVVMLLVLFAVAGGVVVITRKKRLS